MTQNRDAICGGRTQADFTEELRLVGGEITREGQELTAAAAAAGLRFRWLDFASLEAQAAIANQGPGAVSLPLVIVGGTYTLQRPRLTEVSACLAALRSGDGSLPADARGDLQRSAELGSALAAT